MSKANGLSIWEEIDKIKENQKVTAHHKMMLHLSKTKISEFASYCERWNLDKQRTFKALSQYMSMPNNVDRLFYLEAKKLVDKGIKINLI